MKIDKDTIKHIANLAMIKMDENEEEKYARSLEQILTYTEILNNVNLDEVDENYELSKEYNKFREDKVKESVNRDLLLQNAKEVENNMFKIPKTY